VRNTSGLEDAFQAMWIVQRARESHHNGCRMALDAAPACDPNGQPSGVATSDEEGAAGGDDPAGQTAAEPAKPPESRRKKK
jgi:hypothetical protein